MSFVFVLEAGRVLVDDRATIIAKVRGWINPKLQIEDVYIC